MEEILDYDEKEKITNYRKWAFRCFIYLSILLVFTIFIFPKYISPSFNTEQVANRIKLILVFGGVISLLGFYFIFKMVQNKEPKKIQYWVSIIGIPFCIILFIYLIG